MFCDFSEKQHILRQAENVLHYLAWNENNPFVYCRISARTSDEHSHEVSSNTIRAQLTARDRLMFIISWVSRENQFDIIDH